MLKNLNGLSLVRIFRLEGKKRQIIFLITIALFFLLNLLVSTLPFRLDASYGRAYTLSDSSKKILRNLDSSVTIKFFASSDLPTRLLPLKADVVDLLNEYQKDSYGKLRIQILDPKKDQKALTEAKEAGVPQLQFSQLDQDKYAVTASYFGIVINYKDTKDILPQVTDLESLEYNLTATIYKLVRKEVTKIGIIGQYDSPLPQGDNLASLKALMAKQFEPEFVSLATASGTTSINSSLKTILVFDDTNKQYDEYELNLLREYLNKKGKAIFFVDGVWVNDSLTSLPANHNLFSLFSEYGINLERNLILSAQSELVNFGNGEFSVLSPYPFWISTSNFSPKVSYFSNVNQITYPWVSSLNLSQKNGFTIEELVKTSQQSWQQTASSPPGGFTLNPQTIANPQQGDLKAFIVGAKSKKDSGGEIVVIPSSRFVLERYMGRSSGNLEFVLNLLNDLASDGVLSGIRSRSISFYPLPGLSEGQKDIFKYANILTLPALFGLFGIIRLLKRR